MRKYAISIHFLASSTRKPLTKDLIFQIVEKNSNSMVFFRDTKLVSVHLDLPRVQKGDSMVINSSCDPELSEFYDRVLMSIRGVQRATSRLLSIQGVTDLLECDSYLRRFYAYVTGSQSTLQCQRQHYANNLQDC